MQQLFLITFSGKELLRFGFAFKNTLHMIKNVNTVLPFDRRCRIYGFSFYINTLSTTF